MKTPHDTISEESLVSCIIEQGDSDNLLDAIQSGVSPDSFWDIKCRLIFAAMLDLHSKEMLPDMIGVMNVLKSNGQLKACSASDVNRIMGVCDTTSRYHSAKEVVLTKASQRKALDAAREVVAELEGEYLNREEVSDAVGGHVARINNALKASERVRSIVAIVDEAVERADMRISGQTSGRSISFGIPALDKLATPIEPHELAVIAARPSTGKSSLSRQIARHNMIRGRKVAMFVLESSDVSVMEAMAAEAAKVSVRRLRDEPPERQRAYLAELQALKEAKDLLRVYDKDMTLRAIEARCKTIKAAWSPELVVVDYLQIIRHHAKGRSRADEIGEVTKTMIGLVKYMECAILLMSQLTRGVERDNRQPVLSDLRDSGSIESDATRVLFIYRPDRDLKGVSQREDDKDVYLSQLIQRKLRDGPQCKLDVNFVSKYATFEEL